MPVEPGMKDCGVVLSLICSNTSICRSSYLNDVELGLPCGIMAWFAFVEFAGAPFEEIAGSMGGGGNIGGKARFAGGCAIAAEMVIRLKLRVTHMLTRFMFGPLLYVCG